ncbi:MAG TPA: hypothetical protein DER60_11440 [Syntrophomonas sp.]|nr:hypothetical protein [Syntrophomonas sp.]
MKSSQEPITIRLTICNGDKDWKSKVMIHRVNAIRKRISMIEIRMVVASQSLGGEFKPLSIV